MSNQGFRLSPRATDADRILFRVAIDIDTRCWNWLGAVDPNGYGRLSKQRRTLYAHRLSFETFTGSIPAGLQLDHTCRNRQCCNPEHLEAVTGSVNVRRGESPGAKALRRSRCVNGHDLAVHAVDNRGRRICGECRRIYMKAYKERRAAERVAYWQEVLPREPAHAP